MRDGARAYILVAGQHVEATWDQAQRTWVVGPPEDASASTSAAGAGTPPAAPQVSMDLLYMDNPVVRLPGGTLPRTPEGGATHRVSLLLRVQSPATHSVALAAPRLAFVGSDMFHSYPHPCANCRGHGEVEQGSEVLQVRMASSYNLLSHGNLYHMARMRTQTRACMSS
jgi:hypothetical protein